MPTEFKDAGSSFLRAALASLLLIFLAFPVNAQDAGEALVIGVHVDPPFVMKGGEGYEGVAIDLWESLPLSGTTPYRYTEYESLRDLLRATENGSVDVAVTNIIINQSRAHRMDLTQPWFDGGMRILVGTDKPTGFRNLVGALGDAGFLRSYAWIALVILAATLLLTVFDRRFDKNFPGRWRDGIAESFYSVMSVATTGRPPVRKNLFGWMGRIWQAIWLVCGIAVLAYVTSTVTSVMTTLSLTGHINGLEDLGGKRVGVLAGTVEEEFSIGRGYQTLIYNTRDKAVHALIEKEIDAFIDDAPVLEYYVRKHPELPIRVTGSLFEPHKYGFALPLQSPLTRDVTIEALGALDTGVVDAIRRKYLGHVF
ncbi:transporter substrate-binding domain-containing protein [Alcaligenaceae bacterium]|nr:transporter substrate-binding domain-containing protein [Alcaligenaceae bacterium]